MNIYQMFLMFLMYSFLGWCTEVSYAAVMHRKFVNRGFLNGPVCSVYGFGIVLVVSLLEGIKYNYIAVFLCATVLVSALEYITGFLLEKLFHHRWWDYSEKPFNLHGYICLAFSMVWGAACMVVVYLIHPLMERMLLWLPLKLGRFAAAVLFVVFSADLIITVIEILKLNTHLKKLQETKEELLKLSNMLGENISKGVINGVEKQENLHQKLEEKREKYQELSRNIHKKHHRLLKAFPGIRSVKYKEALQEIKKSISEGR